MNECKIITFSDTGLKARTLKNLPGPNPAYAVQMKDYPAIEQEINAYLRAGFNIQNISYTHHNAIAVVLVR